jgi:beta-glucanase (GH16 family)
MFTDSVSKYLLPSTCLFASYLCAAPPEGYTLAWADEFEGERLDVSKWEHRTDSKHWSTQTAENVRLADGKLYLDLKKDKVQGKDYTGSGIISREAFKYGYYEASFRVPPGSGWHTSFWLMWHDSSGGTSPGESKQEIDICEQDSVNPHNYAINLHDWEGEHKSYGHKRITTDDLSADFHTWGCEFTEESIRYYFEGELVQETDATVLNHGDNHIWLTSIASFLGGTEEVDEEQLPASAVFEYVRYYTKSVD